MTTRRAHLPALDGLRGLAVLLVMATHYRVTPWPWTGHAGSAIQRIAGFGWCGVDLFFVLSGFLITGILRSTRTEPHYFRNFYARRTLRIFPLYYVALFLLFIGLPRILRWSTAFPTLPVGWQLWFWTYTVNLRSALWPTLSDGFNTVHFWSLAVEEQFYLIWPTLLWWLDRRGAVRLAVAALVLAPIIRLGFVWHGNVPAAYGLMPARMDALACGALLALMAEQVPEAVRRTPWRWVAVSGTALAIFLFWDRPTFIGRAMALVGYTLVALWWTAVLAAVLAGTRLARLCSGAVIRWVGRRSYALYVLHYPILIACRRGASWIHPIERASHWSLGAYALFVMINLALVALAAEVSWRLLEAPCLRLKDRFQSRPAPFARPVRALAVEPSS